MDERLKVIQEQRKIQGVKWKELAENLPISAEGLRIAFSRGSVDPIYLKLIEEKLGVTKPTAPGKEKPPHEDARMEDLIAQRVVDRIKPVISEFTDKVLRAVANLDLDFQEMKNTQEEIKLIQEQTKESIENIR